MQAVLLADRAKQQHVASQKAKDNYILARASAIKRKREGATEPDQPVPEPQRKLCHWSYLLVECAWMSKDIRSERRWRKQMAFIIAHEAAAACGQLRKVSTSSMAASAASGGISSCETGFEVSIKTEQGVASGISGMKCIKSTDIVSSSLLVYDYSLMHSAVQLAMEKLQDGAIKRKIEVLGQLEHLEEAQREYVACMQTSAGATHPSQHAAAIGAERSIQPAHVQEAWQDRSRRRQWVAGMRPDGEAALARRHLPVEAAAHRRADLTSEDDRLLMCLLAEFGESSPTLVAEVFSSIRRLDGVHMDRNIVVARKQARQPVRKEDARSFLRWSMPCSGNSVLKYAQIIRPVASRMLQEQKNDYENACMKRSEMAMHMASKHESHQAFIGEALAHFGGVVPSPSKLLAFRRKAAEAAAQEGGGAGMQGGGGAPGSGGAGGGNGAAQQPGIDGNEGGAAMGKNGNSAAGSPAQTAGPGSGGPVHGAAGLGGGPGAGPGGGVGNGSMPVPQQPPPQQPMQAREAVPPGSYAVPAHAVHQHVHPHQAHAAHAQAAARGSGMVMPPQSGPMMSNGPDEQAMAMGPGGMMLQPQLVQVPASAAGMHPQYQAFDGMHMQQAPMHQMPRRGPHAQHGHPMHPQAMHMPMIDQDGMMTAPPMGLMHMGPPMGSGPQQIPTMHPGMPQGPPGHPNHQRSPTPRR